MERKQERDFLKKEPTLAAQPECMNNPHYQQRRQAVLRDMKNTATKRISNIKSAVGSWSERLRRSIRTKCQTASSAPYTQMTETATRTPVKLYSPFGIETPNSRGRSHSIGDENLPRTPRRSMRRTNFASPSGRFKHDVRDVSSGILELNQLAITISKRKKK